MSRKPVVLVTGASGEMGHGLIHALAERHPALDILALDLKELEPGLVRRCSVTIAGDILDKHLLERLASEFEIHTIFHLAALLSTRAELTPEIAHEVNVTGTLNLLAVGVEQSRRQGRPVKFLFPSSIAVYGLPDLETKRAAGRVGEGQYLFPTTMYGCNKLYCEHLGRYFSRHYRQLAVEMENKSIDFRCIRFPGLISAFTVPTGGTSDYLPEMLHAAARGKSYECFVREDARIPFMAMPDGVRALLMLMDASPEKLSTHVYNIGAYNPSAGEFAKLVRSAFARAQVAFVPDVRRQGIVDSWPEDVDDSRARADWGFAPEYGLSRSFEEYLLPNVKKSYVG